VLFGSTMATGSWEGVETAFTPRRRQHHLGVSVGEEGSFPHDTPISRRKEKKRKEGIAMYPVRNAGGLRVAAFEPRRREDREA